MLLQHRLHGLQLGEVLTHVRVEDHLDAQVTEFPELCLLHVRKDVAVVVLDHPGKKKKRKRI